MQPHLAQSLMGCDSIMARVLGRPEPVFLFGFRNKQLFLTQNTFEFAFSQTKSYAVSAVTLGLLV